MESRRCKRLVLGLGLSLPPVGCTSWKQATGDRGGPGAALCREGRAPPPSWRVARTGPECPGRVPWPQCATSGGFRLPALPEGVPPHLDFTQAVAPRRPAATCMRARRRLRIGATVSLRKASAFASGRPLHHGLRVTSTAATHRVPGAAPGRRFAVRGGPLPPSIVLACFAAMSRGRHNRCPGFPGHDGQLCVPVANPPSSEPHTPVIPSRRPGDGRPYVCRVPGAAPGTACCLRHAY